MLLQVKSPPFQPGWLLPSLCCCSVIILGLDSSITSTTAFPYICTAKAWVLMAGFTLSFGSMFSKTWRVHSIFTNVQLNKKASSMIEH